MKTASIGTVRIERVRVRGRTGPRTIGWDVTRPDFPTYRETRMRTLMWRLNEWAQAKKAELGVEMVMFVIDRVP